jgi:hypothetical protein
MNGLDKEIDQIIISYEIFIWWLLEVIKVPVGVEVRIYLMGEIGWEGNYNLSVVNGISYK